MNYIDLLLFIIVVWCILVGVRRGFLLAALGLCSWLGSLVIGFVGYKPLSSVLLRVFPPLGVWSAALSFILIIIVASIILNELAGRILQLIPLRINTWTLNKILGIVPGFINGFIWAALLAALLLLIPFSSPLFRQDRQSKLAAGLVHELTWLDNRLSPIFGEALNRVVANPGGENGEKKFIKLPFQVAHPKLRPGLEAEMLRLVNHERTSRGIAPLKPDTALTIVARKHSADMLARGYFSHYTPNGTDPFDRMRNSGIRFLVAGENVALAPTLPLAHTGLMHSPGHRANILNPAFGRVGIGIEDAGIYGLMVTQDFRN